ncbi:MAG: DUF4870 domain-containing protein [Candidatus Hadarchaeia archaeon]
MADGKGKTDVGLEENVEGALCYVLFWLSGIIFLLIEKKSKFVRFHAIQSIIVFLSLWIIGAATSPFFSMGYHGGVFSPLRFLSSLIWLIVFIIWLLMMYKAYQGERYKLPIAGDIAENKTS